MLRFRQNAEGVTFEVRVKTRAKRVGLLGVRGEVLRLGVAAPAERGRANRAVIETLASALGIARSRVEIVAGRSRPDKVVRVVGLAAEEVRRRLT